MAELPSPECPENGILVQVQRSLISAGTERTSVEKAKSSLLERARSQPDDVKKVLDTMKKDGIIPTFQRVMNKLDSYRALGYSAAGVVVESRTPAFAPGDRVACAGAQCAHHAEIIAVPRNLAVRIPARVEFDQACYTTLGAIAMQGVRQAGPLLGETVAVIGLGLLGQITVQLLKANGCRVVGLDINENLFAMAKAYGADLVLPSNASAKKSVEAFSRGLGVDSVIITAATSSNEPLELALDIARRKAKIVVVGAVGMNVPRSPFYEKEQELLISCSYGPGRYDPIYEEKGIDYPAEFVRWTENRNMEAFLDLMAQGRMDVVSMTTHHFRIADAEKAYDLVTGAVKEPYLGIVLDYPERQQPAKVMYPSSSKQKTSGPVGVGFIGAGSFAQAQLLPHLKKHARLVAVSTGKPLNAETVARQFGFENFTTDSDAIIGHKDVNTVFVATRHDSHARWVSSALKAGKSVFVEKPLCLTRPQLAEIEEEVRKGQAQVMVGFNRRFSAPFVEMKKFFGDKVDPMSIVYRANVGAIPLRSWVQDPEQGGRIIGEACHFIDCMVYLTGALPAKVFAANVSGGNVSLHAHDIASITIVFTDGSIGTVHYFANGAPGLEKEYCEAFCQGKTAIMNNFTSLQLISGNSKKQLDYDGSKGHREEMEQTASALAAGAAFPISWDEIYYTTLATIAAEESLNSGGVVELR